MSEPNLLNDFPTQEIQQEREIKLAEVMEIMERFLGPNYEFVRQELVEGTDIPLLYEVRVTDDDGSYVEYTYIKKGRVDHNGDATTAPSGIINAYYDSDDFPLGGYSIVDLVNNEWVELKEDINIYTGDKASKLDK